jgi:hypothetical protein
MRAVRSFEMPAQASEAYAACAAVADNIIHAYVAEGFSQPIFRPANATFLASSRVAWTRLFAAAGVPRAEETVEVLEIILEQAAAFQDLLPNFDYLLLAQFAGWADRADIIFMIDMCKSMNPHPWPTVLTVIFVEQRQYIHPEYADEAAALFARSQWLGNLAGSVATVLAMLNIDVCRNPDDLMLEDDRTVMPFYYADGMLLASRVAHVTAAMYTRAQHDVLVSQVNLDDPLDCALARWGLSRKRSAEDEVNDRPSKTVHTA